MNRPGSAWILIALFLLLEGLGNAAPSSLRFPAQQVVVDALPGTGIVNHGYVAHRFEIHNSSGKKQKVTIALPDKAEGEEFKIHRLTRTVTVPPRSSHTLQLLQPPLPLANTSTRNSAVITVGNTAKPLPNAYTPLISSPAMNTGADMPFSVLLTRTLERKQYEDEMNKIMGPTSGPSPGATTHHGGPMMHHSSTTMDAEFETAELRTDKWSAHWLTYSRYDYIVLTPADWTRAAPEVQQAILRWVRCGGQLWFTEADSAITNLPVVNRTWTRSKPEGEELLLGWGEIWRPLPGDDPQDTPIHLAAHLNAKGPNTSDREPIPLLGDLKTGVDSLHNHWGHHRHNPFHDSQSDFNEYFPVVSTSRVPVRLVVGLLTLFVFIAGPIVLIILTRKQRRIAYLWVLPAISFGFSGLVFLVSWFSEGVTPRVRLHAVTVLDLEAQEATTIGGAALYAPLAPNRLLFDGTSEVTPLLDPNESDPGNNRQVEWTAGGGQTLTGGWVSSRIPTHFAVRKSQHSENRLEATWRADGTPEILNGLGGSITSLLIRHSDGRLFIGHDIQAGGKATLEPVTTLTAASSLTLPQFSRTLSQLESIQDLKVIEEHLPNGSFWARMDSSPFLENPLEGRNAELERLSHVVGHLQNPGGTP